MSVINGSDTDVIYGWGLVLFVDKTGEIRGIDFDLPMTPTECRQLKACDNDAMDGLLRSRWAEEGIEEKESLPFPSDIIVTHIVVGKRDKPYTMEELEEEYTLATKEIKKPENKRFLETARTDGSVVIIPYKDSTISKFALLRIARNRWARINTNNGKQQSLHDAILTKIVGYKGLKEINSTKQHNARQQRALNTVKAVITYWQVAEANGEDENYIEMVVLEMLVKATALYQGIEGPVMCCGKLFITPPNKPAQKPISKPPINKPIEGGSSRGTVGGF